MRAIKKRVYLAIGWLSVGLAVIGAMLPVMPTVPFLIVAFWAFSRSSPRLSRRILAHPHFGPILRNWLRHQAIPFPIKLLAIGMMAASCVMTFLLKVPVWAFSAQLAICISVAIFIITRPKPPVKT